MTIETPELGLRERKRLATFRAIQVAAVSLATEQGVDRVTVDEISRIADISPRTFFNYFPTKEAALAGDGPQMPDAEAIDAFVAAGSEPILRSIAALLAKASALAAEDHELLAARRSLLKQHPHLFAMRMGTMRHFENDLQAIIERRLDADGVAAGPQRESRARLITLVSFAAMRHAWGRWADSGSGSDLAARLDESFAEVESLLA
jgi:AcrR family transcriptional regulator